jgi:xanthine dehydrogenase accessory factor
VTPFPILIKGAGDLATGVALRLMRCGFPVILTELAQPLAVRRTVAFAQAVFDGTCQVEEITARRAAAGEAMALVEQGIAPVLVEPSAEELRTLAPAVLVDAILAKYNTGTQRHDAPLVIALGPGFVAGVDCHAVIETNRGHWLGRVIWQGAAEPNTGTPGVVAGRGVERVLRAPATGHVKAHVAIGDTVAEGDVIATLTPPANPGDEAGGTAVRPSVPLRAPFSGILRGMIHPSVVVTPGMKIGDLDARAHRAYCFTVSDKALAIGGGVLEVILAVSATRTTHYNLTPRPHLHAERGSTTSAQTAPSSYGEGAGA